VRQYNSSIHRISNNSIQFIDYFGLAGFGRFIKSKVEARNGINPKTGQPIKIAAYMQPRFKAGTKLKEACNKTKNPKSSKTNFKSHREVKISFMYDWLLTSIYPLKKHLKTCF